MSNPEENHFQLMLLVFCWILQVRQSSPSEISEEYATVQKARASIGYGLNMSHSRRSLDEQSESMPYAVGPPEPPRRYHLQSDDETSTQKPVKGNIYFISSILGILCYIVTTMSSVSIISIRVQLLTTVAYIDGISSLYHCFLPTSINLRTSPPRTQHNTLAPP